MIITKKGPLFDFVFTWGGGGVVGWYKKIEETLRNFESTVEDILCKMIPPQDFYFFAVISFGKK